jgi:hypothetical protein
MWALCERSLGETVQLMIVITTTGVELLDRPDCIGLRCGSLRRGDEE